MRGLHACCVTFLLWGRGTQTQIWIIVVTTTELMGRISQFCYRNSYGVHLEQMEIWGRMNFTHYAALGEKRFSYILHSSTAMRKGNCFLLFFAVPPLSPSHLTRSHHLKWNFLSSQAISSSVDAGDNNILYLILSASRNVYRGTNWFSINPWMVQWTCILHCYRCVTVLETRYVVCSRLDHKHKQLQNCIINSCKIHYC